MASDVIYSFHFGEPTTTPKVAQTTPTTYIPPTPAVSAIEPSNGESNLEKFEKTVEKLLTQSTQVATQASASHSEEVHGTPVKNENNTPKSQKKRRTESPAATEMETATKRQKLIVFTTPTARGKQRAEDATPVQKSAKVSTKPSAKKKVVDSDVEDDEPITVTWPEFPLRRSPTAHEYDSVFVNGRNLKIGDVVSTWKLVSDLFHALLPTACLFFAG